VVGVVVLQLAEGEACAVDGDEAEDNQYQDEADND
jgi:hypothetical protein